MGVIRDQRRDRPLILFVNTPSGIGGSTRSLANVLDGLRGRATRVVTTTKGGRFPDLVRDDSLADRQLEVISNRTGLRPLLRAVAAVYLAGWTWRHRKQLTVVHANGLKELSVITPAIVLTRVPLVVWVHNHSLPPSIKRLGWLWRRLLRGRDVRWAAVSTTGSEKLEEAGLASPAEVTIIPNPIDPDDVRAERRVAADVVRIGYLGSPERYKGFHFLPEMIERTSDLPVQWLLFAEQKGANPDVWERIWKLEATGKVIVKGKFPDVRTAYSECDLVFCPSLLDSFCRVAAEAMMNGIAVVGSDLEPIRALLGDDEAGIIFARGDLDAAETALRRLVADEDERSRMGEAGRLRAAAYGPAGIVEQLAGLYGLAPAGPERASPRHARSA